MQTPDRESRMDALFAAYRAAVPDPEPGAAFMPGLWAKIENRQNTSVVFRRLTQAFVAAAAAAALFMAAVLIPRYQNAEVYSATYADVLSRDQLDSAAYDLTPRSGQR